MNFEPFGTLTHVFTVVTLGKTEIIVPPKLLLEKPYPPNLITVPSCRNCNVGHALDEQYFLVVLAQCADNPQLQAKVAEGGTVERTLKSPSLDERLRKAMRPDQGEVLLEPEGDRIMRVLTKLAMGLFTTSQFVVIRDSTLFQPGRLFRREADIPYIVRVGVHDAIADQVPGCQ